MEPADPVPTTLFSTSPFSTVSLSTVFALWLSTGTCRSFNVLHVLQTVRNALQEQFAEFASAILLRSMVPVKLALLVLFTTLQLTSATTVCLLVLSALLLQHA